MNHPKNEAEETKNKKKLKAKKGFEIHHNEYHRVFKEGDDISDIPDLYLSNLKTEKVI